MNSSREKAKKIVEITKASEQIIASADAILKDFQNTVKDTSPKNNKRIIDAVRKEINSHLDTLCEIQVSCYVSTFSESELQNILDFYSLSNGVAILKKMPDLIQRINNEVYLYSSEVMTPKIEHCIGEVMLELAKEISEPSSDKDGASEQL
jgi:hypothetical protein